MTAHIATINFEVLAKTIEQAQAIAQDANKHMFNNLSNATAISQLTKDTFLVTLGCNQYQVQQAHKKYLSEYEM